MGLVDNYSIAAILRPLTSESESIKLRIERGEIVLAENESAEAAMTKQFTEGRARGVQAEPEHAGRPGVAGEGGRPRTSLEPTAPKQRPKPHITAERARTLAEDAQRFTRRRYRRTK